MYNPLLHTFVCVADNGSFNKAAEKLFISSTAVIKQINSLEAHLSLQLVERSPKGIRLTPAGEIVYRDARILFASSRRTLAEARAKADTPSTTFRVGTSILNPALPFMDLWSSMDSINGQYKLKLVPFNDDASDILSVIDRLGEEIDFFVGICDSQDWLRRVNFYHLGECPKTIAVASWHPLAQRERLTLDDLAGETLMMVDEGDSPGNDCLRQYLQKNCPSLTIEGVGHYYDMNVFNRCEETGKLLLNTTCWDSVHPSLVTLPVDWDFTIPYGLLYPKNPSPAILTFLDALEEQK